MKPTAERVIAVMHGGGDGLLRSLPVCAALLGVSTRSLQRQLTAEGQTFAKLVDAERRALCLDLIGATGLSLQEIASIAGFATVGAFHRAFRRWTGTTPAKYRAELPASTAPLPPSIHAGATFAPDC
jgi:AraC-like DNA-binding protein